MDLGITHIGSFVNEFAYATTIGNKLGKTIISTKANCKSLSGYNYFCTNGDTDNFILLGVIHTDPRKCPSVSVEPLTVRCRRRLPSPEFCDCLLMEGVIS
jgi:hypothetical protein